MCYITLVKGGKKTVQVTVMYNTTLEHSSLNVKVMLRLYISVVKIISVYM